ncbi:hypothetical protein ALC57_18859 [Trachymyrmex cornetzi]|uniref:Uncharacterized protein n=1 Tax=Trachymyrmex cornetzi TaxID=471704 RepID=A0A195D7Q3_9HYME|nr:hypothetical protein ALC57_18859 [Trachymyrmex cornetzi]
MLKSNSVDSADGVSARINFHSAVSNAITDRAILQELYGSARITRTTNPLITIACARYINQHAMCVREYTVTRVSRQLFFPNLESKQIRKLRPVYGPRKGITSRAINVGHRENITWSVYTCPND